MKCWTIWDILLLTFCFPEDDFWVQSLTVLGMGRDNNVELLWEGWSTLALVGLQVLLLDRGLVG